MSRLASSARTLRRYQAELVDAVASALDQHGSVVLQLATAGGKTRIAVELASRAIAEGKRVWFVCHRREILNQTSRSFAEAGVAHGIIASGLEWDRRAEVHICSIGTLARRGDIGPAPDLIVWDECHHIAARSWATVRSRFPEAHHLGLSATPVRLDGKGLQRWFAHLECGPSTRTLIESGHLSTYRLFAPSIPDLRGISSRGGDYEKGALGRAMDRPTLVGDAIEHYKRHAPDGRAIVFASSVAASEAIVERFCSAGISAAHVDANTSASVRDDAIAALADGRIKILSNVELFTEGFDLPAIDVIILLRPTRSLALYHQMIGRGLRTAAWKSGAIVLDHAGLVHEHGLPDDEVEWSLTGYRTLAEAQRTGQPRLRRCPDCSAVHTWATECVECGRAYETADQSIEEIYGHLREVVRTLPVGRETKSSFARRIGYTALSNLVSKGLPVTSDGLIPITAGLEWFAEYSTKRRKGKNRPTLSGFEPRSEFAKRVGISSTQVANFAERGLPCALNGYVEIEAGLQWVAKRREEAKLADGHESLASFFRRRLGKRQSWSAAKLISTGFPVEKDGSVNIQRATSWFDNYERCRLYGQYKHVPSGFERKSEFATRIGRCPATVTKLIRCGLPCSDNGLIEIETAMRWLESRDRKKEDT